MTTTELVLGITSVVGPVLMWFAGTFYERRRHRQDRSEERITRVLDTYRSNAEQRVTMGLAGLVKAGVGTLESDDEIRTLIERIMQYGKESPLGKHHDVLWRVDLRVFFSTARRLEFDFLQSTPEQVLEEMKQGSTRSQDHHP